jgi:hypothetical protein
MELSPLTCNAEELYTVVASANRTWLRLALANPSINEQHVIALLRNPAITSEIIQEILARLDWLSNYKIQFSIVNCPKTPFASAMRMVPMLYWNDLVRTAANFRISPKLRRACENYLRDRLAELTLGEKTSLARTAPRPAIAFLRFEKEVGVARALLQNPHLVEDDLLLIINNETTPGDILGAIGNSRKWAARYSIRLALVRNPNTPLATSLAFLSKLKKGDLKVLANSSDGSELVRRAADRILKGNY